MERKVESLVVTPGPSERQIRTDQSKVLSVPPSWILVPPGDPALTRRLKTTTATWAVQEKKGRKTFSRGLWAEAAVVEKIKADLEIERADPKYARRLEQAANRRAEKQEEYVEDFHGAVLEFLAFHPRHQKLAEKLATAVTQHATPVGSGTVARTERIPIERRAESAVIAWMRHQTTAYDNMKIARVRGQRREVRRQLAGVSRSLLERYRKGEPALAACPLAIALNSVRNGS